MIPAEYRHKLDELLVACKTNLPRTDERMISSAFEYCVEAHKHDVRASGEPYFLHPYEAAMILAREIPLDDVSVVCALLHDVAEDTEYSVEDIREEFGTVIADIVDGATKITDVFKSREITQAESYRKLLLSMVSDVRVMLVKFADRLHNMRTLEYMPVEKQLRIAKETLDIYAPFANRFGLGKIKWELEDLAFKYLNREAYDEIKDALALKRGIREEYVDRFAAPIKKRLDEMNLHYEISGRPKHLFSIYAKMVSRKKSIDEIYDLFAVRVILDTEHNADCFSAYGIISEIYTPVPERFKDYISVPKKNGYQSIHTTVIGPEGRMVEIQIRTREMHEVAEKGVAAHWRYKDHTGTSDPELEDWVSWVRELFDSERSDAPKQLMESFKLNLYQDEIYVFTPKGELKILPKGATAVDFAFEIHSEVGMHCIGAKVNGKIVPLSAAVKSGDQIEIITSRTQTPNKDWEQFVVTHKAKSHIRRWINEERRRKMQAGREVWEKKVKKEKIHLSDEELAKFISHYRKENLAEFYYALGAGELAIDDVAEIARDKQRFLMAHDRASEMHIPTFDEHARESRSSTGGILIQGRRDNMLYSYAQCCNPLPGDEVIGVVSIGGGVKIHRASCKNIPNIMQSAGERLIDVNWPSGDGLDFIAGIKMFGEDRPSMLSDITHAISTYNNTNIRSVTIDSHDDNAFDGRITLYVKDISHLHRLIEKLRKIPGIAAVERFEE